MVMVWLEGGQGEPVPPLPPNTPNRPTWTLPPTTTPNSPTWTPPPPTLPEPPPPPAPQSCTWTDRRHYSFSDSSDCSFGFAGRRVETQPPPPLRPP